jgi:alcohol dehydrogenase
MTPTSTTERTVMVRGEGAISQLGKLTRGLGVTKALLVTDPGIVAAGHVDAALRSLKKFNIEVRVFDGAQENPTTANVDRGLAAALEHRPDVLIGLGGGSAMDCAKGINFVYSCGGKMQDYWGVGKATGPMLPMIAIPTTAGTGSEMQSFALISDKDTHIKMACGDKRAACKIAILDPLLTLTQPHSVTVLTGIDAISHAVETCVTTKRNETSVEFSCKAFKALAMNFSKVLSNPDDVRARTKMQLGAAHAGVAIENSMLGAAHALANPLTAQYDIPHGQAVGVMLPHVVKHNASKCEPDYRMLMNEIRSPGGSEELAAMLTDFCEQGGLKTRLNDLGVDEDQLPTLAAAAAVQWTATFNPVSVDAPSLLAIYESAF